jgi:hypothetical protein
VFQDRVSFRSCRAEEEEEEEDEDEDERIKIKRAISRVERFIYLCGYLVSASMVVVVVCVLYLCA